jgi:D-3-phosphoglycerate dehydrogenase
LTDLVILVSDHLHASGWELLRQAKGVRACGPYESRSQVLEAVAQADALVIRSSTIVDAGLIDSAPRLKVVARAGAQLDNIDIEAATRHGIQVIHVPNANVTAVAEHTFAMLLAIARAIPFGDRSVRSGKWPRHTMLGFELSGKTLGVIGFGRLGRAVAARAQAFEMKVLAYDPYVDLAFARAQGVEIVNFSEVLERADIISLHTALTSRTRQMINAQALDQMKPGAYLVNCVNAGLVDEQALLDALDSGQLAGAAIDTFAQEPPQPGYPLLNHPKVVVTPHLNQNTIEAQSATSRQVVADVLAALRGEDFRHVANLPFNEKIPYQTVKPYINLAVKLGKLQGQVAEGWITRLEVELLGENMAELVRPVTAVLLSGMLLPVEGRKANWVSAPVLAYEQDIAMAQVKGLVELADYPNLIACRVYWQAEDGSPEGSGQRTVAGVLFGNGEARLVQYDQFQVDAYPEGYVLILENDDIPGVIGKVGTRLGSAGINIAQWRYGREWRGGKAVSFINLDDYAPKSLLAQLENEPEIQRARLVKL